METERIVIALDLDTGARPALELAATLAALLDRELEVLFVQDQDLFNLAALPFVSEIDRLSGTSRRLDAGALETMLETVELEWRQELNQLGRSFNLRWHLRRVRGHYYRVAVEHSRRSIMVVRGRETRVQAPGDAPVCLLCDRPSAEDPACRTAAALARVRRSPLLVYGTPPEEESPESLAFTLGSDPSLSRRVVLDKEQADLPSRLEQAGCGLLVCRNEELARYGEISSLLREISCPVVLIA